MARLFLIDANSIIHRCFHALPPLTNAQGEPAQALYGLSSVLLKLWREEKPEYAAACFDRPEPTFRKTEFEAYKAHRPPAPSELISQIIGARDLFQAFGIMVLEKPGYEADDLIATMATKFKAEQDLKIVILTGDLDTLQLVEGERIVVQTFRKGLSDTLTYDVSRVRERYGLEPDQMIDYKALVGDVSDNIPGIAGVGPKTARAILQKFGSVEKAFQAQAGKLLDKIKDKEVEVDLGRRLVTLEKQVPLPVSGLGELKMRVDTLGLSAYFARHGFETLLRRLMGEEKADKPLEKEPDAQGRMF